MAIVKDTLGTQTVKPNVTTAKNPAPTTPQALYNSVFKTNAVSLPTYSTSKTAVSGTNLATNPAYQNTVTPGLNNLKSSTDNETAYDKAVASNAVTLASGGGGELPPDDGGKEDPIEDPAGGTGGNGNGGNYLGGGSSGLGTSYYNPRTSGAITMVNGGSAPVANVIASDNATVAPTTETTFEQRLKDLLEQGNNAAKTAYDTSKNETDSYLEKALQEAYISRMLAERALPQQLAARGLNGGAVESTLAGNQNAYMASRNNIYQDANEKLQKILSTYNQNLADNQQSYTSTIADYLRQLDLMDKEAAINKELTEYKVKLGL